MTHPANLDDYLCQWEDGKASALRERYAPSFVGWDKDNELFERSFERVILALRASCIADGDAWSCGILSHSCSPSPVLSSLLGEASLTTEPWF